MPGQANTDNRMVGSLTGGQPHYVTRKSGEQFVFGGICPRFTANKICQHTIAATEKCGKLSHFCDWWKSHFAGPDIDSLAVVGLPKGVAGQRVERLSVDINVLEKIVLHFQLHRIESKMCLITSCLCR